MDEDIFLEDRLFPWLADDCMSDCMDDPSYDSCGGWDDPDFYCECCGEGFPGNESDYDNECPDCGQKWEVIV